MIIKKTFKEDENKTIEKVVEFIKGKTVIDSEGITTTTVITKTTKITKEMKC